MQPTLSSSWPFCVLEAFTTSHHSPASLILLISMSAQTVVISTLVCRPATGMTVRHDVERQVLTPLACAGDKSLTMKLEINYLFGTWEPDLHCGDACKEPTCPNPADTQLTRMLTYTTNWAQYRNNSDAQIVRYVPDTLGPTSPFSGLYKLSSI